MSAPVPLLTDYYSDEHRRVHFVRKLFDSAAGDYDRVDRLSAFGSGSRYRGQALARAGLAPGMRVLDVAAGTGLIAREALRLVRDRDNVIALDPSVEMLRHARDALAIPVLRGVGESIPCRDGEFDFVSMGYALRHLSDLEIAFGEFFRVLKPGGKICVLEITRPRGAAARLLLKLYMKKLVPWAASLLRGHAETALLMRFYWDTIEACVGPSQVCEALVRAGFTHARVQTMFGIFSEYTATKAVQQ